MIAWASLIVHFLDWMAHFAIRSAPLSLCNEYQIYSGMHKLKNGAVQLIGLSIE